MSTEGNHDFDALERQKRKFNHLQTLSIFQRGNALFVSSCIESCGAEKHYKITDP